MTRKRTVTVAEPILPTTTDTRARLIDRIVSASRQAAPDVVPITYFLCTDGEYRGVLGIPIGIETIKPYQTKIMGYAIRTSQGTTVGTRRPTAADVLEHWRKAQDSNAADFRAHLEPETNDRIKSQAAYWLKEDVTIIG